MLFYRPGLHEVENARRVSKVCPRCHNEGEFVLCYAKTGMGIGIPIASLFTDKAILAKKTFVLVCPFCPYNEKVSRDFAAGLMRAGV